MSKTSENNKTDMSKTNENKNVKAISDEFLGKKRYFDEIVIKSVTLSEGKLVRFIQSCGGYYIDFRHYYKDHPTRKGFRMQAKYFKTVVSELNDEVEKYTKYFN